MAISYLQLAQILEVARSGQPGADQQEEANEVEAGDGDGQVDQSHEGNRLLARCLVLQMISCNPLDPLLTAI